MYEWSRKFLNGVSSVTDSMLTLFWDERGVILEHYMPRGAL